MSNKSKFPLGIVILIILCLFFAFICFLGYNFTTNGDTAKSFLFGILWAAALIAFILVAIILKHTRNNFKTKLIIEFVCVALFCVTAVLAVKPFSHFFAVTQQKNDIYENVKIMVDETKRMYNDYEAYADNRIYMYRKQLRLVVASKNIMPQRYTDDYNFVNGEDDATQIDAKMKILEGKIKPNFNAARDNNLKWSEDALAAVSKWKPIGIAAAISTLGTTQQGWAEQLASNAKYRAPNERTDDFDIEQYKVNIPVYNVSQKEPVTWTAVLIAVVTYQLMLVIYIVSPRNPASPGVKRIFSPYAGGDDIL